MKDQGTDPLGRDTGDFWLFVKEMVKHAESGKDRDAIDAEIAGAEKRLGIVKPVTVHAGLVAWQVGEITEAEALELTGCDDVIEMYKSALSSNVEIKIPMTPEQAAAVAALDWSGDRT